MFDEISVSFIQTMILEFCSLQGPDHQICLMLYMRVRTWEGVCHVYVSAHVYIIR